MKETGLRIPVDLYEEVVELAKLEGRSLNAQIVQMVKESAQRREKQAGGAGATE